MIQISTKLHLLKSVILPVLLYGLESAALLSHYLRHLQAFDNIGHCITLGISMWKKRRNTYIGEQVRVERIETTLMIHRLCFLGHIAHMDDCIPKQLLVCAHARGLRALGGQCQRWKDVIHTDLHHLDSEKKWCQKPQNHSVWDRKWRMLFWPGTL